MVQCAFLNYFRFSMIFLLKPSSYRLRMLSNVFLENNECILAWLYKSLVETSLTEILPCGLLSSAVHTVSHFQAFYESLKLL